MPNPGRVSILDGMPSSAEDLLGARHYAAAFIELYRGRLDAQLTPRVRHVLDLMGQGVSLGQIAGIETKERDAILLQACRLLQSGDARKARDLLIPLFRLEPLDARVVYVIAATCQSTGDIATAGKIYVHFLALDATNVEGYLRLAECFLAAGEAENAADMFTVAISLSEAGHGDEKHISYARMMMDRLRLPDRALRPKQAASTLS